MSIYTKTADGWVPIVGGGSEPGAATITAITGSGITHTYGDFVAFEFLTSGSLTCTEGLVPEALIVGGGGGSAGSNNSGGTGGNGSGWQGNIFLSQETNIVTIGAGGAGGSSGTDGDVKGQGGFPSRLGNFQCGGGTGRSWKQGAGTGASLSGQTGVITTINNGILTEYARGGNASGGGHGAENTGNGANGQVGNNLYGFAGGSGVVIVKVKASNAANVDKSGWTEVTAAMLAAAEKKRKAERKKLEATRVLEEKKLALEAKNEELSGATQMDIEGDLI